VSKHEAVLIIEMKCILLNAFVGGYIAYTAVLFNTSNYSTQQSDNPS
jgi:hypothetical protein